MYASIIFLIWEIMCMKEVPPELKRAHYHQWGLKKQGVANSRAGGASGYDKRKPIVLWVVGYGQDTRA